jgi:hypothetical protein
MLPGDDNNTDNAHLLASYVDAEVASSQRVSRRFKAMSGLSLAEGLSEIT